MMDQLFRRSACTFFSGKKNMILAVATWTCNRGRESLCNALHQNTGPTNWQSKLCDKDLTEYIWWKKIAAWWILLGLGPWCMVKLVVKLSVHFWKRKIKTNKCSSILRHKLRGILTLHTYSETSPQTSPAELRQQKFANKISPVICSWQTNMLPLRALTQTSRRVENCASVLRVFLKMSFSP